MCFLLIHHPILIVFGDGGDCWNSHQVGDRKTLWTGCQAITAMAHLSLSSSQIKSRLRGDISYPRQVLAEYNSCKWHLLVGMDGRSSDCYSSEACRSLATPLFCHCRFVFQFDMHIICIMHIWSTAVRIPPPFSPYPHISYSLITNGISYGGFFISWMYLNVSGCLIISLTLKHGRFPLSIIKIEIVSWLNTTQFYEDGGGGGGKFEPPCLERTVLWDR